MSEFHEKSKLFLEKLGTSTTFSIFDVCKELDGILRWKNKRDTTRTKASIIDNIQNKKDFLEKIMKMKIKLQDKNESDIYKTFIRGHYKNCTSSIEKLSDLSHVEGRDRSYKYYMGVVRSIRLNYGRSMRANTKPIPNEYRKLFLESQQKLQKELSLFHRQKSTAGGAQLLEFLDVDSVNKQILSKRKICAHLIMTFKYHRPNLFPDVDEDNPPDEATLDKIIDIVKNNFLAKLGIAVVVEQEPEKGLLANAAVVVKQGQEEGLLHDLPVMAWQKPEESLFPLEAKIFEDIYNVKRPKETRSMVSEFFSQIVNGDLVTAETIRSCLKDFFSSEKFKKRYPEEDSARFLSVLAKWQIYISIERADENLKPQIVEGHRQEIDVLNARKYFTAAAITMERLIQRDMDSRIRNAQGDDELIKRLEAERGVLTADLQWCSDRIQRGVWECDAQDLRLQVQHPAARLKGLKGQLTTCMKIKDKLLEIESIFSHKDLRLTAADVAGGIARIKKKIENIDAFIKKIKKLDARRLTPEELYALRPLNKEEDTIDEKSSK